jgi:hypothetical protein
MTNNLCTGGICYSGEKALFRPRLTFVQHKIIKSGAAETNCHYLHSISADMHDLSHERLICGRRRRSLLEKVAQHEQPPAEAQGVIPDVIPAQESIGHDMM